MTWVGKSNGGTILLVGGGASCTQFVRPIITIPKVANSPICRFNVTLNAAKNNTLLLFSEFFVKAVIIKIIKLAHPVKAWYDNL